MERDSITVLAVWEGQKWGLGEDRDRREGGGGKGVVKRETKEKEGVESGSTEREKDFRSSCGSFGYILSQQLAQAWVLEGGWG